MNKILGIIIVVLAVALLIIEQSSPEAFLDIYGLGVVIAAPFGVLFFSYGDHVFSPFRFITQPIESQKDYLLAVSFFDSLANTFMAVGVTSTLIGHIAIVTSIDEFESLMPATGVSYLTTFYGFIIARLLIEPMKQNIVRKAKLSNVNAAVEQHLMANNDIARRYVTLGLSLSVLSTLMLVVLYVMEMINSSPLSLN